MWTPSWKTSFGDKASKTDITGEELDECVQGLMDRSTSFPNFGILFGEAGKFDESTGRACLACYHRCSANRGLCKCPSVCEYRLQ